MDKKSLPAKPPRKMKFKPKAPPKKEPMLVLPKVVKNETDFDEAIGDLLDRRYYESSLGRPKIEKKAEPVQVAFGHGGSSSSIRSYGAHKVNNSNGGTEPTEEKEYKEPWNYYSVYPVSLPLRRPYTGNPELLNKEEFGEDMDVRAYDENETNAAEELGLLDEDLENKMFFLQLPSVLPGFTPPSKLEVPNGENKDIPEKGSGASQKTSNLESLPAGYMGKMLIYKSGAVKMKIGDILYDVTPGMDCTCAQDVVVINREGKHCCNLGEISKRAVITPDIDSLLDAVGDC